MGSTGAVIGAERLQGEQQAAISSAELQEWYDAPAYEPALVPAEAPSFTAGAATAEELAAEAYGNSGRLSRAVGALIAKHTIETETPEVAAFVERGRQEFFSNVTEKIKTHPKLREYLDSEDEHIYYKVNGRIMTADGVTPIVDLIGNGAKTSAQKAETDERMKPQARRDEIDHRNMQFVEENLAVGEGIAFVSVDPKDEFRLDPDFYKNLGAIGYREGLAFIQWFKCIGEGKYVFSTYSVENSNLEVWRKVLAKRRVHVPEGEPTSSWHQYGFRHDGSREEMRAEMRALRNETYAVQGLTHRRYSATEFVEMHRPLLEEDFNLFMRPLMRSAALQKKDPVIHTLVETLLAKPGDMNEQAIAGLRRIQQSDTFDEESRQLVEHCITYGAFMKLEPRLKQYAAGQQIASPVVIPPQRRASSEDPSFIAGRVNAMAGGVHNGLRRGIRVGGCSGELDMSGDGPGGEKKGKKEESATTDVGREKAAEDAAEGGESKTMCCPECGKESDREDVVHMTGPDEGYLECPHCSFFADVCTGESGYRNGHEAEKPAAQDSAAGYVLAALGIKNTSLTLGKSLI